MPRALVPCLLAVSLGWGACWGPASPRRPQSQPVSSTTYRVRLHRARAVGERYRVRIEAHEQQSVEVSLPRGPERTHERRDVALDALVEVLEVDAHGHPLRSRYTIERFVVRNAQGREQRLPAGTVLQLTRGARPAVVEASGAPLTDAVRRGLRAALEQGEVPPYTDDDLFGSESPRGEGERWAVHQGALQQGLSRRGIRLGPPVQGEVTLQRVAPCPGGRCMTLGVELHAQVRNLTGLARGAQVDSGTLRMSGERELPLDSSQQPRSGSLRSRLSVRMHQTDGAQVRRMHLRATKSKRTRYLPEACATLPCAPSR